MTTNRFLATLATTAVLGLAAIADAKPWKSAEMITRETYKYGAFEARIKAAEGSGFITTFFLWKDGSEWAGAEWQEQDFEIWGMNGLVQSQAMTPGNPRTEHTGIHTLPTKAYDRYYTYRMEWTPSYLAYYIDGQLVRKETDTAVYSKLLNPARAEAMQLRTGLWAGDFGWSGPFDSTKVPQDSYVNWLAVYNYTPGAGPNGSDFSLRWKDEFNTLDWNRWWAANWTFEYSVSDYTSRNLAVKDGILVQMMRHWTTEGILPATVPTDDGAELPLGSGTPTNALAEVVPASSFVRALDLTSNNEGYVECGEGPVDLETTADPQGGCNIAYTYLGEWLEYDITSAEDATYEVSARLANLWTGSAVRMLIDGDTVGIAESPNTLGWQVWENCPAGTVTLSKGKHTLRVEIAKQYTNVLSYAFTKVGGTPEVPPVDPVEPPAPPVLVLPAQVTGLAAVAGNGTATLSWNASANATSYQVIRDGNVAGTVSTPGYSATDLLNGTSYSFRIVAVNADGSAPTSATVVVTPVAPVVPVPPVDPVIPTPTPSAASVKAQLQTRNAGATTNGISPLLKLVNTGSTDLALSDLTVRYWYTNEGGKSQSYWCDWAQLGQGNILSSFKTVSPARTGADAYLEIGFKASAGTLMAGSNSGEIQSRFSKSDWSNYTQTNDHSYNATASSYTDWNKVTVYYKGELVWGVEP